MASACWKVSIIGSILLSFAPGTAFSQRTEKPVDTTLCDLVKSADKFNEKIVRFRALIVRGMESVILYDKSCGVDARVELEWPEESDRTDNGEESFEYAFISSPDAVKYPARLRWRKPLPSVRLLKDKMYARFSAALHAERPQVPGIICVSCPLNSVTATMTGRFEHASLKAVRDRSKKIEVVEPFGFGHLNMWASRFILQSVSEFVAKPLDESPSK